MNADEYRTAAGSTAMYPGAGKRTLLGLSYLALGLNGEVSEIAELVTQSPFGSGAAADTTNICHELGDALWYDAMLTAELGISDSHGARGEVVDLNNGLKAEFDPFSPGSHSDVIEDGQQLCADLIRSIPMTATDALFGLIKASGQVAEIVKKAIRSEGEVSSDKVAPQLEEVRWFIGLLGDAFRLSIEEIRAANIAKLAVRFNTGTIKVHA